jgi:hypothetical protein
MSNKQTITKNQEGMASLVIVILIMTLLSLIVLSMTKNANREQQQSLERQLNNQAFYAAESGINDARDYYTQHANDADPATKALSSKTDCSGVSGAAAGDQFPGYTSTVGATINKYSCVLYDANPDSLIYSDVSTGTSILAPIRDKSGNVIKNLTFTWKIPNDADYDFSGCPGGSFPQSLSNCDAGFLRIELIDLSDTSRDALVNNDFVAYIAPGFSGAARLFSQGRGISNQGVSWTGNCTSGSAGECQITIQNINLPNMMLHMKSIYNHNQVEVTGTDTSDNPIHFKNAQMMIDATGKATDVLKRLQVRVPLSQYGNGVYPEFSLQAAGGICKLLQIIPQDTGQHSSAGC